MAKNDMYSLSSATASDLFGGFGGTTPQISDPGMSIPDLTNATPGDIFGGGSSNYDPVTGTGTFGQSGSSLPPGYNPTTGQYSSAPNPLGSLNLGSFGSPGAGSSGASTGSGVSSWLSNFLSGNPANGGASGLAPYLAAGAGGLAMAKSAQNQATAEENQLKALGKPYTDAGQSLLKQFQSGTLRPDQQKVVDTSSQFSSQLMTSATPLGQIAQQAFSDYNSGKLPPADEQKLQDQIASQKQQARQMLQSSGITDSSVLLAQDQQIQNQAMETRQSLLDARFATGNKAYDSWLKTTSEGQQLKLQGQQFASQSFETMLSDSLGLSSEGMQPAMQAIQLKIQSDAELSQTVSELLGNLASAYSYAAAGPKTQVNVGGGGAGGGGGQQGGGSSGGLGSIISGIGGLANTVGNVGKLFGFSGASGQAAGGLGALGETMGVLGAAGGTYNAIKNWQSGDTGGDALRGAEAGASIGSIVPGIGTLIGGAVGAVAGAISSAFGPGKESAGHKAWNAFKGGVPAGTPGSQIPTKLFEESLLGAWQSNTTALSTFVNMPGNNPGNHGGDAEAYKGWLENTLAGAATSGKIKPGMDSQQVFDQVVGPAMDQYWKSTGSSMSIAKWNDPRSTADPKLKELFVQLTDRALTGQGIGRGDESDYSGQGYKQTPGLQQILQQQQTSAGKKTVPKPVMGAVA